MTILKDLKHFNFLEITLSEVIRFMQEETESNCLGVFTTEAIKAKLKGKKVNYPYCYLVLNAGSFINDQQNNAAVSKEGTAYANVGQRVTTSKAYTFPTSWDLEFHYINSDIKQTLLIMQLLLMLSSIGGHRFDIKTTDYLSLGARLEIPANFPIPLSQFEDAQNPGAIDLSCNMILHCHIGFIKNVAAVNSNKPIIEVKGK